MKIDKATEILTFLVTEKSDTISANEEEAVRLGIEAMKRIHSYRTEGFIRLRYPIPLPGETLGTPPDTAFRHTTADHRFSGEH